MKTWFITGTSTGLGWHMAETALQRGDQVVLTARHVEGLADRVAPYGGKARVLALDVTDPAQIAAAWAEGWSCFDGIDVLVNNAGWGLLAPLEETGEDALRRNLETNLVGPLRLMRAAVPGFRDRGRGHVISVSAIAAFANEPGFGIYGASKAALEAASEALACEVAPFGIKVSVIVPGPFRTDFIGRSLEAGECSPVYASTVGKFGEILRRVNGRQPGDPRKAAEAIYSIAGRADAPFRLVLGKYATEKFEKKLKALETELQAWREVGLPTEFSA